MNVDSVRAPREPDEVLAFNVFLTVAVKPGLDQQTAISAMWAYLDNVLVEKRRKAKDMLAVTKVNVVQVFGPEAEDTVMDQAVDEVVGAASDLDTAHEAAKDPEGTQQANAEAALDPDEDTEPPTAFAIRAAEIEAERAKSSKPKSKRTGRKPKA